MLTPAHIQALVMMTLLATLAVAFAVMVLHKTGLLEWMQLHSSRLLHRMLVCGFCLCFWLAVVLCVPLAVWIDINWLAVPALAAAPAAKLTGWE